MNIVGLIKSLIGIENGFARMHIARACAHSAAHEQIDGSNDIPHEIISGNDERGLLMQ